MHVFRRAAEESNDFKEMEKASGQDLYFTKKAFVVENIIRTRIGYVPVRITEKYLAKYLENIKNDKKGFSRKKINAILPKFNSKIIYFLEPSPKLIKSNMLTN